MRSHAHIPEELETLLEDAFVTRDAGALARLFDEGAVLAGAGEEARGRREIARLGAALWRDGSTYLAQPGRVLQAGATALLIGDCGTHVARRRRDGSWRYAISSVSFHRDIREDR